MVRACIMAITIVTLPGDVRAHHGLLRPSAFETPITFHLVGKTHWTVQWFIQAIKLKDQSLALVDKH